MLFKTRLSCTALSAAVVAGVLLMPNSAIADPSVLSFSYTQLSGSYTSATGNFVARATTSLDGGPLFSIGNATRLVDPVGFADFSFAPWLSFGSADFVLDLSLTDIDPIAARANATGTLTATDVDGDVISGDVSGSWVLIGGQATFTGGIYNFMLSTDDGSFNGLTSAFSMDFSDFDNFIGVVTDVTGSTGGFFQQDFGDRSSLVTTQVIPAPGAGLLGVFGLGTVAWIRRRV